MINEYSVGLKVLKQSSAEPLSGSQLIIKIPDVSILQQSPS